MATLPPLPVIAQVQAVPALMAPLPSPVCLSVPAYNDARVRAAIAAHVAAAERDGKLPRPEGPVGGYRGARNAGAPAPENRGLAQHFSVTGEPGPLAHRRRGPGRPPFPEAERVRRARERHRARQRAYRTRRRSGGTPPRPRSVASPAYGGGRPTTRAEG
jgi:hypothetical protein